MSDKLLSADEKARLIELTDELDAACGVSDSYLHAIRVMDAAIMSASALPAHLFAEPEKVASKPLRAKWR